MKAPNTKIAWLFEDMWAVAKEPYEYFIPDAEIDFYKTAEEVLSNLDKDYTNFILGMRPERTAPYTFEETCDGSCVGLRLYDDIRKHDKHKRTPVIICSTTATLNAHMDKIEERKVNSVFSAIQGPNKLRELLGLPPFEKIQ